MWPFLVSLLGLGAGLLLAKLVPEEVEDGEKYFFWVQQVMLSIMVIAGFLYNQPSLISWLSLTFLILIALLFSLQWKLRNYYLPLITYFLAGGVYFLATEEKAKLIIASLIFLFGLPSGTLLWINLQKKKT